MLKKNEAQLKYIKKTYEVYRFNFRKVEDADVIEFVEKEKSKGLSVTDIIRKFVRGEYESEDNIEWKK